MIVDYTELKIRKQLRYGKTFPPKLQKKCLIFSDTHAHTHIYIYMFIYMYIYAYVHTIIYVYIY